MHAVIRRYDRVAGPPDDLQRAGVLASVSFFETAADLAAADRLVAAWEAEHRGALLPRPPQVTGGEVVVQRGL